MNPTLIISILIIVILRAGTSVDALARDQASYEESLREDLRSAIASYLTRETSHPDLPFRLSVTLTGDAESNARLIDIRCHVEKIEGYPALDVDLRSFITTYVRSKKRGAGLYLGLLESRVDVRYLPQSDRLANFLESLTALVFAGACLVLLYLVQRRAMLIPSRHHRTASGDLAAEVATAVKPRRIRQYPTSQFEAATKPCRPHIQSEGSWCLRALDEASAEVLHATFSKLSFDEALILLRHIGATQREQVVRSLELRPAIRSTIEEFVANKNDPAR